LNLTSSCVLSLMAQSHSTDPPQCMQLDEPEAANQARRRLLPRRSLLTFFRRKSVKSFRNVSEASSGPSVGQDSNDLPQTMQAAVSYTTESVDLDDSTITPDDHTTDVYRWAIIYENQRGLTLFSTAYYSPLGLLPLDPPAFTLPDTNPAHHLFASKSHEPSLTLVSYPLPDGNWRWVSKSWMVDMRGDVQYDGFEYNWLFRKGKWRSDVGNLSGGAWVRRRRWVRLMVKPAKQPSKSNTTESPALSHVSFGRAVPSSQLPSVAGSISESSSKPSDMIWEGDPHDDWLRCREYLRSFPQDGKKLEIWKQWFGSSNKESFMVVKKQWTEDDALLPSQTLRTDDSKEFSVSPAPMESITPIIRENIDEILKMFVFPDSRALFFKILRNSGIPADLKSGGFVSPLDSSQSLNFWSYANEPESLSDDKGKGKAV